MKIVVNMLMTKV